MVELKKSSQDSRPDPGFAQTEVLRPERVFTTETPQLANDFHRALQTMRATALLTVEPELAWTSKPPRVLVEKSYEIGSSPQDGDLLSLTRLHIPGVSQRLHIELAMLRTTCFVGPREVHRPRQIFHECPSGSQG